MSDNNNNNDNYKDNEFKNQYERMLYQKRQLEQQDELIESMIGLNKENKELGKEMGNNLKKQVVKLEEVNSDMDKVSARMNKTTNRFERYIENTSYCRLYLTIIILGLIILYLLF
jgi:hypothetical protein